VTPTPVAAVVVSPASASEAVGQTVQLTATPQDANGNPLSGRTVTWATSNAGVGTVSSTGLVTGVAAGAATITATSEGKSGSSAITVTAGSTTVTLVGAGNIASCSSSGDEATAALLDNIPGTVYTTGDNIYSSGSLADF